MTRASNQRVQAAIVLGSIVVVSVVRVLYDEPGPIFFIPVILAGLWFGPWWGLATGVVCSGLFAGAAEISGTGTVYGVPGVVRTVVYGGGGYLVGWVSDSRLRLALQLRERDLELAEVRTIQEALAPSKPPSRPSLQLATCYVAAEHGVSGDFYVVSAAPDGGTLIAVGDVAGRGLEAAKQAWYVRTLISSSADLTDDPASILERANRALIDDAGQIAPFVTAACVFIRPSGRVQWALAGHDRPIRLDDGAPLGEGNGAGLPLGVSGRVGCHTATTQLAPGAGLLLYTDGLSEARRPREESDAIELFGEERIRKLVEDLDGSASEEVVSRVREEVEGFSGGELADDMCLIAVRHLAENGSEAPRA